jgi:hypothetical protein
MQRKKIKNKKQKKKNKQKTCTSAGQASSKSGYKKGRE